MLDAVALFQLTADPRLFVDQLRWNDAGNRLADDFAFVVTEDALRPFVPRSYYSFEGLPHDRVVRRSNDGGEPRRFDFGLFPRGYIDEYVDRACEPARLVAERSGERDEGNTRAVGPLENGLGPANRLSLLQGERHRAFVIRHRSPIRRIKTPRAAPAILADLRAMAPQLGRGLVVKGDTSFRIGRIDGDWQRLQQVGSNHRTGPLRPLFACLRRIGPNPQASCGRRDLSRQQSKT